MATKGKQEAQNPLILRCHRLMDAFAKSNDERDFYIDRLEGFMIYVELDKSQEELDALESELQQNASRYVMIPKLTFYETKKIMEGFVNEKVYDIDTKEKLLDIIQSKEARDNFLEFIYDHHSELEKWQQYYQERSRIRIIEWLRQNHFHFVFEEDLEMPRNMIEALKQQLFQANVSKDLQEARKELVNKAKTYYSNEALNPRPKRGRPPKQAAKIDVQLQATTDIFSTVPAVVHPFLFTPDLSSGSAAIFSSKFDTEEELIASRKAFADGEDGDNLQQKLASLRQLASGWVPKEEYLPELEEKSLDDFDDDEEEEEEEFDKKPAKKPSSPKKKDPPKQKAKRIIPTNKSNTSTNSTKPKKIIKNSTVKKKK